MFFPGLNAACQLEDGSGPVFCGLDSQAFGLEEESIARHFAVPETVVLSALFQKEGELWELQ